MARQLLILPDWSARKDLVCTTMDPELFHPLHDDGVEAAQATAACWRCPARAECLEWALANDEQGVWGGTTDFERRQLVSRKTRVKCPGCGARDVDTIPGGEVCYRCGLSWLI